MAKKSFDERGQGVSTTPTYTIEEHAAPESGLDTNQSIKAVTVFQNPHDPNEYIAATIKINSNGVVEEVEMDAPSEYRIASMGAKVRFAHLFLHGPEPINCK